MTFYSSEIVYLRLFHISRNAKYLCLVSLSRTSSGFIYIVACIKNSIPFQGWITFHCLYVPHNNPFIFGYFYCLISVNEFLISTISFESIKVHNHVCTNICKQICSANHNLLRPRLISKCELFIFMHLICKNKDRIKSCFFRWQELLLPTLKGTSYKNLQFVTYLFMPL